MQGKLWKLAALSLLASCATRQVPARFPSTAPASHDAQAAPLPVVGRLTREHPPLPGDATEGWSGLEEPAQENHHAH
ncbi:MAG: hypothetical protein ACAI38_23340 [Myxococcota bacterium]|nr:hypothetical protein [Myxococcota bacterium]